MTRVEWLLENRREDVIELIKTYNLYSSLKFAGRPMEPYTFKKWCDEVIHDEQTL